MTGNLDRLATELINAINAHLDNAELLALAMASKRLHVIALTSYVERHTDAMNTMEDSKVFLCGQSPPLLKPLRMALFIHHLNHFTLRLLRNEAFSSTTGTVSSSDSEDNVVWGLRSLRRFIGHLSTVSDVTIYIPPKSTRRNINTKVEETKRDLLEFFIGKSCSQMTLNGLCLGGDPLVTNEAADSADSSNVSQRSIRPLTSLKLLKIQNSKIHTPELYNWFVESMNLSQITSVDIEDVSFTHRAGCTLGSSYMT